MPKTKKLKDIAITHISLVKAGANGKAIIYKSADATPTYDKQIVIKKTDNEKGIVYGIVYSPNEVDTDGEFTDANEIVKAAYGFMKAKNTTNVDKQHSFENEKAFVAESWIVKKNDSIFPDEKEGSWAVAIKLEDDELKKAVKDGEIAGISMAGTAQKEDVEKADEKSFSLSDLLDVFTKLFSSTSVNLSGHVYNDKINKQEDELKKEDIEAAVKVAVEPFIKSVKDLEGKVETLEKEKKEIEDLLKQSKQNNNPEKIEKTESKIGGIM